MPSKPSEAEQKQAQEQIALQNQKEHNNITGRIAELAKQPSNKKNKEDLLELNRTLAVLLRSGNMTQHTRIKQLLDNNRIDDIKTVAKQCKKDLDSHKEMEKLDDGLVKEGMSAKKLAKAGGGLLLVVEGGDMVANSISNPDAWSGLLGNAGGSAVSGFNSGVGSFENASNAGDVVQGVGQFLGAGTSSAATLLLNPMVFVPLLLAFCAYKYYKSRKGSAEEDPAVTGKSLSGALDAVESKHMGVQPQRGSAPAPAA